MVDARTLVSTTTTTTTGSIVDTSAAAAAAAPTINLARRLVWAQLSLEDNSKDDQDSPSDQPQQQPQSRPRQVWWPALRFVDMEELDQAVHQEQQQQRQEQFGGKDDHGNYGNANMDLDMDMDMAFEYRNHLALCMMAKSMELQDQQQLQQQQPQSPPKPIELVRFLGRPLQDVQPVVEGEYHDYYLHLASVLQTAVCQPALFRQTSRTLDEARSLYMDFHRGMDETTRILAGGGRRSSNTSTTTRNSSRMESWEVRAERAWQAFLAAGGGGGGGNEENDFSSEGPSPTSRTGGTGTVATMAAASTAGSSPQRIHHQHHHHQHHQHAMNSPNQSVAAVSVADDSTVHHYQQPTPASTVASARSSEQYQQQYQHYHGDDDNQTTTTNSIAAAIAARNLPFHRFPTVEPLGRIPWREVWTMLQCDGWTRYLHAEKEFRYQPYVGGPELSQEEMHWVAQQRYSWIVPPQEQSQQAAAAAAANNTNAKTTSAIAAAAAGALQTPVPTGGVKTRRVAAAASNKTTPTTTSSSRGTVPRSNAKDYSFGILWKHQCLPKGWMRVKPPKEMAQLVDYYYLRPGVTLDNLHQDGRCKGEDYFDDHYEVLDWCHRQHYYPTDWSNSCSGDEESTIATMTEEGSPTHPVEEDDPSIVLEGVKSETKLRRKPQHDDDEDDDGDEDEESSSGNPAASAPRKRIHRKKGKGKFKKRKNKHLRRSPQNYSFGVLWLSHLERMGWTMVKAKNNPLTDYYYVRPDCSVEHGRLDIDYFTTTEDVLEYCREHNDYPDSSSCSGGDATSRSGPEEYEEEEDATTIATAAEASTMDHEEEEEEEEDKEGDDEDDEEVGGDDATMGEESSKYPAETEDDQTTVGEPLPLTPEKRPQPRDPGKPLLPGMKDAGSLEARPEEELDEEQKYHWKNVWPMLQKLGWEVTTAKNPLQDFWYIPPRRLAFEEKNDDEEHEANGDAKNNKTTKLKRKDVYKNMRHGVDYFCTQDEVIAHIKQLDRLEAEAAAPIATTAKGGSSKRHTTVSSRSKGQAVKPSKKKPPTTEAQKKRKAPSNETDDGKKKAITMKKPSQKKLILVTEISVWVDPVTNDAPWVDDPLPQTNLHALVTSVGGFSHSGSRYRPHETNKAPPNQAEQFISREGLHSLVDVSDALKYACRLGRGNYYVNPEASKDEVEVYHRLVDYAYVPGRHSDLCHTRPLTRSEIDLCLEKLFGFTLTGESQWKPPSFLTENGTLKPLYNSLPDLLRALRRVENLEGEEVGRRRKPLDKKKEVQQREQLLMAFRLSVAEDQIVNGLEAQPHSSVNRAAQESQTESPQKNANHTDGRWQTKKTRTIITEEHQDNELDFPSESSLPSSATHGPKALSVSKIDNVAAGAKRGCSSPSSSSKKSKKEPTISDLKVKANPSENDAPWTKPSRRELFSIVRQLGVTYSNGCYYLPSTSAKDSSARFSSADEIFKHWSRNGGYNLAPLDEDDRSEALFQINYGNVPGLASSWKVIRKLETHEVVQILNLYEFQEHQPDGNWVVPERILQQTNYRPPLQKQYASLDELRVALRRIVDFEKESKGRRAHTSRKLNEKQYLAFRLWVADGPDGPIDTTAAESTGASVTNNDAEEPSTRNSQNEPPSEPNDDASPRGPMETQEVESPNDTTKDAGVEESATSNSQNEQPSELSDDAVPTGSVEPPEVESTIAAGKDDGAEGPATSSSQNEQTSEPNNDKLMPSPTEADEGAMDVDQPEDLIPHAADDDSSKSPAPSVGKTAPNYEARAVEVSSDGRDGSRPVVPIDNNETTQTGQETEMSTETLKSVEDSHQIDSTCSSVATDPSQGEEEKDENPNPVPVNLEHPSTDWHPHGSEENSNIPNLPNSAEHSGHAVVLPHLMEGSQQTSLEAPSMSDRAEKATAEPLSPFPLEQADLDHLPDWDIESFNGNASPPGSPSATGGKEPPLHTQPPGDDAGFTSDSDSDDNTMEGKNHQDISSPIHRPASPANRFAQHGASPEHLWLTQQEPE